jgi:hypothetical protein
LSFICEEHTFFGDYFLKFFKLLDFALENKTYVFNFLGNQILSLDLHVFTQGRKYLLAFVDTSLDIIIGFVQE